MKRWINQLLIDLDFDQEDIDVLKTYVAFCIAVLLGVLIVRL